MYNKILVPMALDHGVSPKTLKLAEILRSEGGEVIALHVHETMQSAVNVLLDEDIIEVGYKRAEELMKEKLAGHENVTPKLVKGHSARTIIDFAEENAVDCIVMGSHKPGLVEYFLGSTAARVVRHANCAVHVHRDRD